MYVPGFVDIAPEKNLTFVGTVMTKFRVKKSTKKIELNALKLNFPEDFSSIEMFQEDSSKVKNVLQLIFLKAFLVYKYGLTYKYIIE